MNMSQDPTKDSRTVVANGRRDMSGLRARTLLLLATGSLAIAVLGPASVASACPALPVPPCAPAASTGSVGAPTPPCVYTSQPTCRQQPGPLGLRGVSGRRGAAGKTGAAGHA